MNKTIYSIKKQLKAIIRVIKIFIKHPRLSLSILKQLPTIIQGFKFAQEYQPSTNDSKLPPLPDLLLNSNPLRSYFDDHKKGRCIWKWLHYFDIYHQYFKKFIGRKVNMIEIGIYGGGSLEMWRNYFGTGCNIYGVDIQEECKMYENEYTKVFIGDQANHGFWKKFKKMVPKIDIIIDDGGHKTKQQIVTFEEMLTSLSPGGIYICEDIHGIHNGFTSYLYGLTKNLNAMKGRPVTGVKTKPFQSWIKSIHFYPYAVVVEKSDRPEEIFIAPKHGTEQQPF